MDFSNKLKDFPPGHMIPGRGPHEPQYRATLDHVLPRSRGGLTELDNLVLSCQPCNSARGNTYVLV